MDVTDIITFSSYTAMQYIVEMRKILRSILGHADCIFNHTVRSINFAAKNCPFKAELSFNSAFLVYE